jgi:hypothetical protein
MQEQEKVAKARITGYGIGIVAFILVVAWKLIVR